MKLGIVLAGVLLAVCATNAFAQHEHHQQGAPSEAAMMEAMMKAATPGEPHQKLDALAGTWETTIKAWMAPGTEPMTSRGTSTSSWILGGRYLEQTYKGDFGGMPFEGRGIMGYDNVKKQYFATWLDNMSTGVMTATGSLADDGKVWTFKSSMVDPMSGKESPIEEKITIVDADHHVMDMWGVAPDGSMFKMMEIRYARKK